MIKILLVDDEPAIRQMLQKRLQSLQYVVVTAADGEEALDSVRTYKPDLIILDILMPKMDGYRFLEELEKRDGREKHIPVIILTARKQMRDIISGVKQVRYFVEKPFKSQEIMQKIETITQELKKQKGKVLTALLIGMDWDIMRPIKTLLESREFLVFTAKDASHAVEEAVKHPPDMVFAASLIAGMDVSSLCTLLSSMPATQGVPIIVYDSSGHLNARQAEQIKASKVIDYKTHDDLVTRIDEAVKDFIMTH